MVGTWKTDRTTPLLFIPSKRWAIGVAAGDERTGIPEETPSTRSEKGPATREVVSINQFSFAALSADFAKLDAAVIMQTWLLMHYRDDEADEIRIELSLPAQMTQDGFVTQWKERIILWDDGGAALAHLVPAYDVGLRRRYDRYSSLKESITLPWRRHSIQQGWT